ncbi:MAG: GspH/FimT family pseudopilin [Candidatus Omnitrophica bacterium]|nr:GspH/FimT family pseudopilin [Candidatus Omnitrophota bacterium]
MSRGFTLVELLVVIGVIGILLATSVPALSSYTTQVRLKTATREIVGLLLLARSLAISHHAVQTVLVDTERGELSLDPATGDLASRRVRLPPAIEIDVTGADGAESSQVTFQPSGALAGRSVSVTLSNGKRTHTIVVTGPTGAVLVQ